MTPFQEPGGGQQMIYAAGVTVSRSRLDLERPVELLESNLLKLANKQAAAAPPIHTQPNKINQSS